MKTQEWLTKEQRVTLDQLKKLLIDATSNGLFDELCGLTGDIDTINNFCDMVESTGNEQH